MTVFLLSSGMERYISCELQGPNARESTVVIMNAIYPRLPNHPSISHPSSNSPI
ncbi:hypothetical protein HBI56_211190 [Parastagonospora nodorum]|uniref:Uncharacterized protein n=1 Tax=Phaeosphaeria nodorum (strain SN15 / ATCC MYA-4574 / FGSC 10173) TaxID=321614 RepID=A0A7U2F5A4_PHANO|nr:hypothetical protein HBH56_213180 [Parastagonospora nodorum]QRC97878.1 hypothetical protein JI435_411180 [Parastagonospora nodorum SN15]KAH3923109.1 hypothetical protein HBH54_214850 [Parastagonospora nodorum]KAH3941768.1 hypothetical protein HBH53_197240 [Parastagonospora nodorum]KAH3961058.1 hypothetical protein HBH51_187060 [Parastagonospora nodorum]